MTTTDVPSPPIDEQMDEHVEDESVASDAGQDLPGVDKYEISFYGADYPVDSLCRRLVADDQGDSGEIVTPLFQRRYVWTKKQADRFIESILLGLPVPGIFLSVDPHTRSLTIIDGLQRLVTLKNFFDGTSPLGDDVHRDFVGKSYDTLPPSDRRDFDNTIIHATVVRQDNPPDDNSSLYHIFERLNTGGTPAQPHEVRRSLYGGSLNYLIETLDENENWRHIYGARSKRLKDQELILRFIALFEAGSSYGKPDRTMKDFLTSFMRSHREMSKESCSRLNETFQHVVELIDSTYGHSAFRPEGRLNTAVFDAIMVALGHCYEAGPLPNAESFRRAYEELLEDEAFFEATTSRTSHGPNVRTRLSLARHAFERAESA